MFGNIWNSGFARMHFTWTMLLLIGTKMQLEFHLFRELSIPRIHGYGLLPFSGEFNASYFAFSCCFLVLGALLTMARLKNAGWPLLVSCFLLFPRLNLVFILILFLIPDKNDRGDGQSTASLLDRFWPRRKLEAALLAMTVTLALGAPLGLGLIYGPESYQWTLFLGIPFFAGLISVILYSHYYPVEPLQAILLGTMSVMAMGFAMLVFALEGLICIIMAAVPAIGLAGLGSLLGYFMQKDKHRIRNAGFSVILCLPISIGLDYVKPVPLTSVVTEIVIKAPAQTVWDTFIEFPRIPEPTDILFNTGIAYPTHAEIQGRGVGAIRLCHFSTGPFVEPIHTWDEPRVLGFSVTDQPHPMKEMSPYGTIHPPHLDGFLRSEKGELRIIDQGDGTVIMRGTTWYRQNLGPDAYWLLWSNYIIGRVHKRVLGHIKTVAEAEVAST